MTGEERRSTAVAAAYVGTGATGAALYSAGLATGVATGASAVTVGVVAAPLVLVGGAVLIIKSNSWKRKDVRKKCIDEAVS